MKLALEHCMMLILDSDQRPQAKDVGVWGKLAGPLIIHRGYKVEACILVKIVTQKVQLILNSVISQELPMVHQELCFLEPTAYTYL